MASQFVGGGVNSDGVGSILMNVVWTNGSSGQYNARAYDVQRTRSGGLTAGLRGTTVDTSGSGAPGASWNANGQSNGVRPSVLLGGCRCALSGIAVTDYWVEWWFYGLEDRRLRPSPA